MSENQLSSQLQAAEGIPIAQLTPDLQDAKSRVVRGVVTITWPYSIINKTIAFLLAEPDFRLRRAKGQVRVEFSGSSAKAVADARLGCSDEILLSLDGVELVADDSKTRVVPGTSLDWQMKFKERLLLQAKISDSDEVKLIDIDHPAITEPEPVQEQPPFSIFESFKDIARSPEPATTPIRSTPAKRPAEQNLDLDEYASPAFLKRARVSYGSLFEGNLSIFDEDDIGAKARAVKRAKTGRYSGVWRYASQSPSPEPQPPKYDEIEDTSIMSEKVAMASPSRPSMVDGACQTIELASSPPRDVQVVAHARHDPSQLMQTPSKSSMVDSGVQSDMLNVAPDSNSTFGQPAATPIFTSAEGHYSPAFEQAPIGPVFVHELEQTGMEQQYHSEDSFHQHSGAYPEAGLEHSDDTHGQYPASFLETPHFDSHVAGTSQAISGSIPAYRDHHPSSEGHTAEAEHHMSFIDAIPEPQQFPWGLTSAQHHRSNARFEEKASPSHDVVASGNEGRSVSMQRGSDTQAVSGVNWVEARESQTTEHDEDRDGEQAALRVEEDLLPEDHDGPEEEFTARQCAERHFEPAQVKEEQDAAISEKYHESSESSSADSDDEAENEEDDAGGDYDITNYRNLSNNQDDDDGSDLESDYGQKEEEEIFDPVARGNEEDEADEDEEKYGEEYDEYDKDEEYDEGDDQENQQPAAAPTRAPQIISLLSDSEDEEDDIPSPPIPAAQVHTRRMPQLDGSTDEIEYDPVEGEESDGEHVQDGESPRDSSSASSEEESEEEEKDDYGSAPTFKHRETAHLTNTYRSTGLTSLQTAGNATNVTPVTVGDDLETMSPVQISHPTNFTEMGNSRPASCNDSEMLDADLEPRTAAGDALHGPDSPLQTEVKKPEISAAQAEQTRALSPDEQKTDTAELDTVVDADIRTEEVRNAPQESIVAETHRESAEKVAVEPMDINMTDTEEQRGDDAVKSQSTELEMDNEKTSEPLLDEDELIQSQLQNAAMMETHEQPTTPEASVSLEPQLSSADKTRTAVDEDEDTSLEVLTVAALEVAVEVENNELLLATAPGQNFSQDNPDDMMDLDRVDEADEAEQTEMASPPPTQRFQSQSLKEIKLIKTQVSQVSEGADVEHHAPYVQLPTPSETQIVESFVPQSFTETLAAEGKSTDLIAPNVVSKSSPGKQAAANAEILENPVDTASPINDELSQIRDSSAQPSEAQSSLIAEDAAEQDNTAQPTPRRGRRHRRNKSDNKDQDPSVKLARASIASRRSTRLSDRTTPDSTRVTRARSHSLALRSDSPGEDEDTSVQLARAAIKSPSRVTREAKDAGAGDQTAGSLKARLAASLRAEVPDCISLKVLRNHQGKAVDVLAIATTEPPEAKRAKGGPRGIMLAFNVTDPSVAPAQTVPVQIFRPHKAALPVVHPGDAILLRHFSVMSLTGRGFGLRANDGSSWAVFERQSEDNLPQIRGPPVELTEGEGSYAALLKQWYASLDAKSMARLDKANEAAPSTMEAAKECAK